MNELVISDTYKGGKVRQSGVGNQFQERDRREKAISIVAKCKLRLEQQLTPLVAKECLSLLFRQRGIPSVDIFTYDIISSFRRSMGLSPEVPDVLRRIVTLGKWSNSNMTVTMWTIEPVIASTHIYGNTLDLSDAESKFSKYIDVIEPLTMTSHNISLSENQMKGRWAGWLASKQYEDLKTGNPSCVSCNLCGPSFMFAIHRKDSKVIHLMMTPESMYTLANYSGHIYTMLGTSASLITITSTRLKLQPSLNRPRSTALTLYGNGSMQFAGSPIEIPVLYPSLLELVKVAMDKEMSSFLKTMRRADSTVF
ncbi:hypothetical protein KC359_g8915 [Hortaea werneckii]|nr:hypothetical protein KC359_g8915 [Hortaea werneckii]